MSAILTLNAGSSSLKFAVYAPAPEPELNLSGLIENLGPLARMKLKGEDAREIGPADHAAAVRAILSTVEGHLGDRDVVESATASFTAARHSATRWR
ncbi:hypothetical protein ACFSZS_24090 [Seohaeicola zhoushanensis]